jgi:hypothetical protein
MSEQTENILFIMAMSIIVIVFLTYCICFKNCQNICITNNRPRAGIIGYPRLALHRINNPIINQPRNIIIQNQQNSNSHLPSYSSIISNTNISNSNSNLDNTSSILLLNNQPPSYNSIVNIENEIISNNNLEDNLTFNQPPPYTV